MCNRSWSVYAYLSRSIYSCRHCVCVYRLKCHYNCAFFTQLSLSLSLFFCLSHVSFVFTFSTFSPQLPLRFCSDAASIISNLIVLIFCILPLITFNFHTLFLCPILTENEIEREWERESTFPCPTWYKTHHSSALSVFRKTFPTLLNYEHTHTHTHTKSSLCTWRGHVETPSSPSPPGPVSYPATSRKPQIDDGLLNYSKRCTHKFGVGRAAG